jgi:CHASE1-domain containing sensor protein
MNNTTEITTQVTPPPTGKAFLPVIIVTLFIFTATLIAGYITEQAVKARLSNFFNRQADQIANTYYANLYTHVTVLEGLRGLWNTQNSFSRESFLTYVNSLSLDTTYKAGISSFFVISPVETSQKTAFEQQIRQEKNLTEPYTSFSINPASNLETLYPVTYVEPIKGREASLGLDFGTFPDRLDAIVYARDNNTLSTTMPLVFMTTSKPGFFFFLPLYQSGLPIERTVERRAAFAGVVGAAFRIESAFAQIFGETDPYPYLDFQIYQGESTSPDRLLHDHDESFTAEDPRFSAIRIVRLKDQTWTIAVQGKPSLTLGDSEQRLPLLVFGFGIIMTILIAMYSLYQLSHIPRTR